MNVRRTVTRSSDGREIIYFDRPGAPVRDAVDRRAPGRRPPPARMRRDPFTDEWVPMVEHRQGRPVLPGAGDCPLCPSRGDRLTEIPAGDYQVVVFENRFPAFSGPGEAPGVFAEVDMVAEAPAGGRCEVLVLSDDHDGSLAALCPDRIGLVVAAWVDRAATLRELPGVAQVYCFENRGPEIGVTLRHPHGQIHALPVITPRTARMLSVAEAHRDRRGRHPMADYLRAEWAAGTRVIARNGSWTALVPAFARWPVDVMIIPDRWTPDLPELTEGQRADLAGMLALVFPALDRYFDRPLPYIAAWYQSPVDTDPALSWLHLRVFSILRSVSAAATVAGADNGPVSTLKYLAGTESGMGLWINDVTPERIARRFQDIMANPHERFSQFSGLNPKVEP